MQNPLNAQWFPVYPSQQGIFQLDGNPSSRAGTTATVEIDLDTFPTLVYGARFETSYELPLAFFTANPAFKQQMREGGVDDDYDVSIQLTQGNVTVQQLAHVANLQGRLGINKHPWPVFYPLRGGNKVTMTARRNSSYPQVIDPASGLEVPITILWKVTLETARGIRNVADGISSPAAPPSSGYP
jgi:hypothetical protein